MQRLLQRLLGDDDAVEDIEDSLESLVKALCNILRLLARFVGLLPSEYDDDDDDDDDHHKGSTTTNWAHLGLTLFLPIIVAVLYRYFRSRCMKDSDKKKAADKDDQKTDSSASSSTGSSPEDKSGWFSKYSVHLDLES